MENNDELVEFLKEQVEAKDKQIEALNAALMSVGNVSPEKQSEQTVWISEDLFTALFAFHLQGKQDDSDLERRIQTGLSEKQNSIARERFLAQR